MSQRPIKQKNMNASGLTANCMTRVFNTKLDIRVKNTFILMKPSFINIFKHHQANNKVNIESLQWSQLPIV